MNIVLHSIRAIFRNKSISILAIHLIFTWTILACTLWDDVANNLPPVSVLFQDDFSDPSSGWDQIQTDDGIIEYKEGVYRFYIHAGDSEFITTPSLNFTDVTIMVETTKVGGSNDNYFGILCRYKDARNFYFFIISSDGYYGVGKLKDDQQVLLGSQNLLPSEAINQGEAINFIQVSCIGNMLSLYTNDHRLIQVEDNDFFSGDVGLIAGTNDGSGTELHFDNFKVIKP